MKPDVSMHRIATLILVCLISTGVYSPASGQPFSTEELLDGFHKKGVHLALDDIRESIAEMVYYRQHVFAI